LVAILERTLSGEPAGRGGRCRAPDRRGAGPAIVAVRYAEDGPLPTETELAAEYAVGRNALREAIKVLAQGHDPHRRRYGSRIRPRRTGRSSTDVLAWHLQEPDGIGRFLVDVAELREIHRRGGRAAALRATAEEAEEIVALRGGLAVETVPQVLDRCRFHWRC